MVSHAEHGRSSESCNEACNETSERADEAKDSDGMFEWDDPLESIWSRDVDLSQNKIVEASLFDAGSEETVDERRAPRVVADDASIEHTRGGSPRLRSVK